MKISESGKWLIVFVILCLAAVLWFCFGIPKIWAGDKEDIQAQIKYIDGKIANLQGQLQEKGIQIQLLNSDKQALEKELSKLSAPDNRAAQEKAEQEKKAQEANKPPEVKDK